MNRAAVLKTTVPQEILDKIAAALASGAALSAAADLAVAVAKVQTEISDSDDHAEGFAVRDNKLGVEVSCSSPNGCHGWKEIQGAPVSAKSKQAREKKLAKV